MRKAPARKLWRQYNGIQPGHAGDTDGVLAYVKLGTLPGQTMVLDRVPDEANPFCNVRENVHGSQWGGALFRELRGELYTLDRF